MTTKKTAGKALAKRAPAKKKVAKRKKPPTDHEKALAEQGTPIDKIIQAGDISSLTVAQQSEFLWKLAESMGLEPMSQPFQIIPLDGKLTIYAKRTAADQLRRKHKIRSMIVEEGPFKVGDTVRDDIYMVKVLLMEPDAEGKYSDDSRMENAVGCVGVAGLSDEALGNAIMKCHTKAIRRGTLAFCGLGFLDELEVDSITNSNTGDSGPRRVMPRLSAPPQPAGNSAQPVVIPKSNTTTVAPPPAQTLPQTNPPPANPEPEAPVTVAPTVVLPPSKPPVVTE